jgi:hypothetical protein
MKRIAIIVLALCFLAASLSAQKPAWINPNDTTDLATLGGLPGTLLAQTSRGIFIDEWDAVFHPRPALPRRLGGGANVLTPTELRLLYSGGVAPLP